MQQPTRDDCFKAIAAAALTLLDTGAKPADVTAALSAASRCEARLIAESERYLNEMVGQITPENLHPEI